MARRLISNDRKKINKNRKRIILLGVEGKNKTEKEYFKNFNASDKDYIIIFAKSNITDPVNMVCALKNQMNKMELNIEYGDKVYCVIDTDDNHEKDKQLENALNLANKCGIEIIPSNPCFEEWFLCHFEKSTKEIGNKEIIKELKKYIPKYAKNKNIYEEIFKYTDIAIKNAKYKNNYHLKNNRDLYKTIANPSSQVYKIIEELNKNK